MVYRPINTYKSHLINFTYINKLKMFKGEIIVVQHLGKTKNKPHKSSDHS